VNQLKQFEARQVQLSKDIQLATAQLKAAQSVPTLTEAVREEADEMLKTKEGRMRVREFLRSTVDRIVVDAAHGVSQIHFKSGFVGTMNVLVGEEEELESGVIRVKLTGPVNFTIRGP
jgi:phosphomannomutase